MTTAKNRALDTGCATARWPMPGTRTWGRNDLQALQAAVVPDFVDALDRPARTTTSATTCCA
jgi:hypothetical protein